MRAVLRSVSMMVLGSGTQLLVNALAGLLSTAWLPVSERGLMILILSAAAIVALLSGAGMGNVLRARLPLVEDEDEGAERLVVAFTRAGALLVALSAVLAVLVSYGLAGVDARMATPGVAAAMAVATAAQVSVTLLVDARFARARFAQGARWAAAAALTGLVTMSAAAGVAMAAGAESSAVLLTTCQFGGVAAVAVLSAVAAFRNGTLRTRRTEHGEHAEHGDTARLLGAGIATMALPLALVLITRGDRLVLGAHGSLAAVAVYGLAATYCEMLRIVPTAVGQLAVPRIAAGGGLRAVARLAGLSLLLTVSAAAVLYVAVAFLTVPLFGPAYADAVALTLLLIPGEIMYALVVLANLTLIGGQWSRAATIAGVVSLPVAFVLFTGAASAGGGAGLAVARGVVFLLMAAGLSVIVSWCLRRRRA